MTDIVEKSVRTYFTKQFSDHAVSENRITAQYFAVKEAESPVSAVRPTESSGLVWEYLDNFLLAVKMSHVAKIQVALGEWILFEYQPFRSNFKRFSK